MTGFCLFAALFQFVVTGNYGAPLTARIQLQLFTLSKQIRILGAFERMESITISLWGLTDLVLICIETFPSFVLLFTCCAILQQTGNMEDGRSAAMPLILLLLAGAHLVDGDAFVLELFARRIIQPINAVLGYGVPIEIYIIEKAWDFNKKKTLNKKI